MSMCRAQCYDGASNMKKAAKEIKAIEPRVLHLQSKRPRRYEDIGSEGYHPVEPKAHYRQI